MSVTERRSPSGVLPKALWIELTTSRFGTVTGTFQHIYQVTGDALSIVYVNGAGPRASALAVDLAREVARRSRAEAAKRHASTYTHVMPTAGDKRARR